MRIYSPCHQDKAHTDWALTYTTTRHENAPDGHAGADFVDVSLGIIVCMAADTILAFHPLHCHGTTYCDCVHHSGVVFTFSKSIHPWLTFHACFILISMFFLLLVQWVGQP